MIGVVKDVGIEREKTRREGFGSRGQAKRTVGAGKGGEKT